MAINLSPRDFDNIFREQEENENELARIELDQARQELQREKNELARARNDIARRRIELAERELREKEARQERRRQQLERQRKTDNFALIISYVISFATLSASVGMLLALML